MKPHDDSKCGVCATPQFERNNYFYGKQFTVRDLLQEQSYFNDKRYLLNRMVLGWGVVCGLDVYWDPKKRRVVVQPGLALDCCGHEIVVCEDQYLSFDKNDDDCCLQDDQQPEGKFVLCLEYDECHSEPVDLPPAGCDEKGKREYNRIRDTFKLHLKPWDEACPREPREEVECPDDYKHDAKDGGPYPPPSCKTPNVHHFLCEKLKKGCPECESCDCVILATITFPPAPNDKNYPGKKPNVYGQQGGSYQDPKQGGKYQGPKQSASYQDPKQGGKYRNPKQGGGHQGPKQRGGYQDQKQGEGYQDPKQGGGYPDPKQGGGYQDPKQGGGYEDPQGGGYQDPVVDLCTNRKLVYNNSLLYDLIYCYHGDLPHIVDFSWRQYAYPAREITFDLFQQMIGEGVTVYFDQDMVDETLNVHTFMISYLYRETGTGTYVRKQLPALEIRPGKDGDCYTATFVAREDWIKDELDTPNSELRADTRYEPGVDVEIVLRGSRIWSTGGKGLDGDFLRDRLPTGNGTQGGDFVDWFRVIPAEEKPTGKSYEGQF